MKTKKQKRKKHTREELIHKKLMSPYHLAAVIDDENNQIRFYSKDMLLKRIKKDSPKVSRSFDRICHNEIHEISDLFSRISFLASNGYYIAEKVKDDMRITSSQLIINALSTIQAALETLRLGYILQPGILLRSVIETISTVAYFIIVPEGFSIYSDGKLDANKTIKYGKQVVPDLGSFHGILSNHYVHINEIHTQLSGLTEFNEMTDDLKINLGLIKATIWSLFVATEFAFCSYFSGINYWRIISENEIMYQESEDAKKWKSDFFKIIEGLV